MFTCPPHRDEVTVAEQGKDLVKDLSWQFVDVGLVVTPHSVEVIDCCYRVPQKYRLKLCGSEGHQNGSNQILILCMFFTMAYFSGFVT